MTTTVHSLGSKWYGEEADPLESLFGVLGEHPLSRVFERFGNFVSLLDDGRTSFFGNFYGVSCAFHITSDDVDFIARLTQAIRDNQRRADYLRPASHEDAARARELADPATGEHVDAHGHLVRLEPPDEAEKGGAP